MTPLVRKLAKEHGVDLASLNGTGVGGRIRKQDVLSAAETAKQEAEAAKQAAAAPAHRLRPNPRQRRHRPRQQLRPAHCAAPPRRCPGYARRLPNAWSSPSRCRPSSQQRSRWISQQSRKSGPRSRTTSRSARARRCLSAVHSEGSDRVLEGLPEGERDDRHRGEDHYLPGCGTSRDCGGHREGSAGSGDQGCRRPERWRVGQADRRLGLDVLGRTRSHQTSWSAALLRSPTTAQPAP